MPDLRYALRAIRKNPLFATVAILSLALGIGANTAIFTLMDQLMLRMLPVKNPEQLVMLYQRGPHNGNNMGDRMHSYPIYQDFQQKAAPFSEVLCRRLVSTSVSRRQPNRARRCRDGVRQLLQHAGREAGRRPGLQLAGGRPRLPAAIRPWC